MTNPIIKSLKKNIDDIHKSNLWEEIKPSTPRQSEYIAQAHADLERCKGNLVRAERCEQEQPSDNGE